MNVLEMDFNYIIKILDSQVIINPNAVFTRSSGLVKYLGRWFKPAQFELFDLSCKLNEYNYEAIKESYTFIKEINKWMRASRRLGCPINEYKDFSKLFSINRIRPEPISRLIKEACKFVNSDEIIGVYSFVIVERLVLLLTPFNGDKLPVIRQVKDIDKTIIVITIAPWHRSIFEENRGYRNVLLDAGRYLFFLQCKAAEFNLEANAIYNFLDFKMEALLNIDGKEISADSSLKKDRDVVLAAVRQNSDALSYADDSLQKDKYILQEKK